MSTLPTQADLNAFLKQAFPHSRFEITHVAPNSSTLALPIEAHDLRPGGTVSGPTMMALIDAALYAAILGTIGIKPMAVTTSLNINFLRKPSASVRLIGECRLLKVGRTLAVGEVSVYSEGDPNPVTHAVGTYALPAQRV